MTLSIITKGHLSWRCVHKCVFVMLPQYPFVI